MALAPPSAEPESASENDVEAEEPALSPDDVALFEQQEEEEEEAEEDFDLDMCTACSRPIPPGGRYRPTYRQHRDCYLPNRSGQRYCCEAAKA